MGKNLLGSLDKFEDEATFERFRHKSGEAKKKRVKIDHRKNYVDFNDMNWDTEIDDEELV